MTYAEARKPVEELKQACEVLRKCQSLRPEDLKGKYRKAYEKAIDSCTEAVKACILATVPWGLNIRDTNMESAGIWLREFREGEAYNRRLEAVAEMIRAGDYEGIMEFLRWVRKEFTELARMAGTVDAGGEKILE